ncbi:MAG: Bifunctional ligase/repressor BirA [Chlamydiae bacterium]|nr:Bifunctional ligase/repressor BirA [Chlamydiota bacterium]
MVYNDAVMKRIDIHFEEIESTLDWAKAHVSELDKGAFTSITTAHQTKGRGRQGRSWISPPGNVCATFCFPIKSGVENIAQLLALSATKTLESYGVTVEIKWPNDILAKEAKLGGVLGEMITRDFIALSLGLNINASPKQLDQPTISLRELTDRPVSAETFLKALLEHFTPALETLQREGFTPFHEAINSRLAYKGDTVNVTVGSKIYTGILYSISERGTLLLTLENGERIELHSGDITHLRRP